jgi:hypothetical protein
MNSGLASPQHPKQTNKQKNLQSHTNGSGGLVVRNSFGGEGVWGICCSLWREGGKCAPELPSGKMGGAELDLMLANSALASVNRAGMS